MDTFLACRNAGSCWPPEVKDYTFASRYTHINPFSSPFVVFGRLSSTSSELFEPLVLLQPEHSLLSKAGPSRLYWSSTPRSHLHEMQSKITGLVVLPLAHPSSIPSILHPENVLNQMTNNTTLLPLICCNDEQFYSSMIPTT